MKILDRDGKVLQLSRDEDGSYRYPVPLSGIPDYTEEIIILMEDERFYYHPGVDIFSIYRALMDSISSGEIVSGGSGITMQLSRMTAPRGKGIGGKLKEMANALRLEYWLTKEEILSLYLNNIPFGYNVRGIEAASYRYWGRSAETLTPGESILLSVIPSNPSEKNPITARKRALETGMSLSRRLSIPVEEKTLEAAISESITRRTEWLELLKGRAPHFLRYFGETCSNHCDDAFTEIRASLDLELNEYLRSVIHGYSENAKEWRMNNGAGIILDNRSGEILGYVGSKDFYGVNGQIDGVRIRRQPGSTLKPFLYALAFENGYLPCSLLPDRPMEFGGEYIYRPRNFDNLYRGEVLIREALASSLNIPAVYLLEQLGVTNFENFLVNAGFFSIKEQAGNLGLGLALGNGEITLLELAKGFSMFPRRGIPLKISCVKGGVAQPSSPIISPYTSAAVCDILSDFRARETGFGRADILRAPFPMMIKTGTADRYQNIWAVGATPSYTAAVWFGSFTGETVVGVTGSSVPAAVVKEILSRIEKKYQVIPGEIEFNIPGSVKRIPLCSESGGRALPGCPSVYYELLPPGVMLKSCHIHGSSGRSESSSLAFVSPRNNSLFRVDPRVPPEDQFIRIEARGGAGSELIRFSINGSDKAVSSSPLITYLPLKKGQWQLKITQGAIEKEISVTVE